MSSINLSSYNLSVIPQTTEKLSTLTAYIKSNNEESISIKFLDSFQFSSASLKSLASNLKEFPITKTEFPENVIKGKGVFPYT